MNATKDDTYSIILFDGVCNLCNAIVQFIIKRDKKDRLRFASLQSQVAQPILRQHNLSPTDLNSFILIENNQAFVRSTGALRVAGKLSGAWPLLYALIIIPSFIRDAVYKVIAWNRYKWFGKQKECWLPTPTLRNKFL
jgi:predicted DCC family thiol-disulfide oxidoreductase YuxK